MSRISEEDKEECCVCNKLTVIEDYNNIECYSCGVSVCEDCRSTLIFISWDNDGYCFDCVIKKLKDNFTEKMILSEFKGHTDIIKQCKELKEENEKLKEEIKYRPDGEGFKETKEHFKLLCLLNKK